MFQLPHPSGPHAIGTVTYHWVDRVRPEIFAPAGGGCRELMVQVWYPAVDDPGVRRAPYVDDASTLVALARLFGLPDTSFGPLEFLTTNAIPGARVAASSGPYPVLLASHGRGGFRGQNTLLVEELVSHGFVVAAIDHPYAASGVAFPDGRIVPFDRRLLPPWLTTIAPGHDPTFQDAVIPFLTQDAVFTLNRLADLAAGTRPNVLAGQLDLTRVGVFGVSLGGIVAAEAALLDERIGACLIVDTFVLDDVATKGLRQPTMWLTRTAATMRDEGWSDFDIERTHASMRTVFQRLPDAGYIVLVPGMFHVDFADGPALSPLLSLIGASGSVPAERARAVVAAYAGAFFDRHLRGGAAPLLERPSDEFPEVLFENNRP